MIREDRVAGAASGGTKRWRSPPAGLRRAHRAAADLRRVGVLASARQTNEENYLTQKFARIVVGTNNVDCCARVCHTPSSTALKRMLGSGLRPTRSTTSNTPAPFSCSAPTPTENHPVVGARIKQAARRRGAALIVVDPRRIELAEYADAISLSILARTSRCSTRWLMSSSPSTWSIARSSRTASAATTPSRQFVKDWPPERVADICGVEADAIRAAARLYATTRPAMIVNGLGMTEHVQGTDGVSALINLALLTGNIGKPGSGVNALRGQNNVQGAAHMGCEPRRCRGRASKSPRPTFERLWQRRSRTRGLHQMEMSTRRGRDG